MAMCVVKSIAIQINGEVYGSINYIGCTVTMDNKNYRIWFIMGKTYKYWPFLVYFYKNWDLRFRPRLLPLPLLYCSLGTPRHWQSMYFLLQRILYDRYIKYLFKRGLHLLSGPTTSRRKYRALCSHFLDIEHCVISGI